METLQQKNICLARENTELKNRLDKLESQMAWIFR